MPGTRVPITKAYRAIKNVENIALIDNGGSAETVRVICQGEITQVLHRFDFAWTEARYFTVIAEKTASLYAAACRLGGHYGANSQTGGSTEARLRALEEYGLELGIGFQIVDDCLELDGDERIVGK